MTAFRTETDALGSITLPADCLYGINTARAVTNFPFPGPRLGDEPEFVRAFAAIKQAAARANRDLGVLSDERARLIDRACEDLTAGKLNAALVVSLLEGSGGTSLNMNVNEVVANHACRLGGGGPGDHAHVHPNDHVNRSQSTNDVVPAALQLACAELITSLLVSLDHLQDVARRRSADFAGVLKLGRTCLQDAQPMSLGQAFSAYAHLFERCAANLRATRPALLTLPLGATAIGTGFGAPDGYAVSVYAHLQAITGEPVRQADCLFDAMANADHFVRLAGELSALATGLGKIANDLMLLSSGPSGGLGELRLPAVQAGSSIMPGKINPVIPMAVRQISHIVAGQAVTISAAAADGMLEINHYEPVMASALFPALRLLDVGARQLADACLAGITPDADHMRRVLQSSAAIATGFSEQLGYTRTSELVRQAEKDGRSFLELAIAEGLIKTSDVEARLRASLGAGGQA